MGYNEKCDIWSTGIVLHVLLVGAFPFYSENRDETRELIQRGKFNLTGIQIALYIGVGESWKSISTEGKLFLSKLLQYSPEKRPSAKEALKDPWIIKYCNPMAISWDEAKKCCDNLRAFHPNMTFQKGVLAYIASQQLSKSEEDKIHNAFSLLDTDKNGRISEEELILGFEKAYGKDKSIKKEVALVMKRIDINGNGFIDYNGK